MTSFWWPLNKTEQIDRSPLRIVGQNHVFSPLRLIKTVHKKEKAVNHECVVVTENLQMTGKFYWAHIWHLLYFAQNGTKDW